MSRFSPQSFDVEHVILRLGLGLAAAISVLLLIWLIKLLLPWLLLLAVGIAGWYLWQQHRDFQQRLYQCFYNCLQTHEGRISALDFAMAAHITGSQARGFLNARAKDFFADFEPTDYGDILYTFHRSVKVPVQVPLSGGAIAPIQGDVHQQETFKRPDSKAQNSSLRF